MVTYMPIGRGRQAKVVSLQRSSPVADQPAQSSSVEPSSLESSRVEASPLYGVAMLKIAMELKKADAAPLDELVRGVLARMRLPEAEFRRYLEANGGLLRTIASKRGY
jgi:hypothetical protein